MSRKSSSVVAVLFLVLGVLTTSMFSYGPSIRRSKKEEPLIIKVTPFGPSQAQVDAAIARVTRSSAVQSILQGTKFRQLDLEYIEVDNKSGPTRAPERFRVVYYDYTNDRTIVAEADLAGADSVVAREE